MIKKWLSSYSLKYPRYIVYMLQVSEYKIHDYLKWHRQVKNFNNIEVRKHFVSTKKSLLLLCIAWAIVLFTCIVGISFLFFTIGPVKYFFFLVTIILFPYILSYGIIVPLLVIKVFIQHPIQYLIIKNAKQKLNQHRAFKIGVAGSYGKTTMREILKTVIMEGKRAAAPPENHNTLLGITSFVNSLKGDEEVLIFELGEYYKGDIKEMCELVRPSLGIITGINEAHLEKFKSLDTTVSTIFELSDWLKDKPLYVNGESDLAKVNALKNHLVYTRHGTGRLTAEDSRTDLNGTYFTLVIDDKRFEFKSKLLGLHQIGPLIASIHIALNIGMPIEKIQKGIENTKPFDHRLEPKTDASGVTMIDDSYNGNPDGVKAVINFLESLKGRRRIYVTPGLVEMGTRTEVVHKAIGKSLTEAGIEKIILIKNSVTGHIETGLKESGYKGEILWFDDSLKMLAALPHLTVSGDVVLLQNDWSDQYY